MKRALLVPLAMLMLAACATEPYPPSKKWDVAPFVSYGPAPTQSTSAAPASATPSATATATTSSASPSATPTATTSSSGCTKTDSGKCIEGGQICPDNKVGQTGTDAQGSTHKCEADGDENRWSTA